jgi:sugar (pentulose or hexulose) kinase
MNGIPSSSLPSGLQHGGNKEQIQNIIAAGAQRDSRTSTPSKSDVTDIPSTPPSIPSAGAGAGAGAAIGAATVTEAAVENEDEMEVEPSEEIQEFDWEELQERYHNMIKERGEAEHKLWDEFTELVNV